MPKQTTLTQEQFTTKLEEARKTSKKKYNQNKLNQNIIKRDDKTGIEYEIKDKQEN